MGPPFAKLMPEPPARRPSHVVHIADADFFARFGRMFRQLAIGLSDEGFRITLLTDDLDAPAEFEATPVECESVRALRGWRSWPVRRSLADWFDSPPALVHVWGTSGLPLVTGWVANEGIPLLIHALAASDAERVAQLRLGRDVHATAICARFYERLRRSTPDVTVIEPLRPALLVSEEPEVRSDVVGRTLGVVWAGRVDEGSGLSILVDALMLARQKQIDVQAALIGCGDAVSQVWRDIGRRGLHDCVSLINAPRLWDQALAGADVLVIPVVRDELSLAPLLAMALGRVVLAARDQPGEWFVEGETAWHFTQGAPGELAALLVDVARGTRDSSKLTTSAAAYVRAHHAVSALTARVADVYQRLTTNGPRGATTRGGTT